MAGDNKSGRLSVRSGVWVIGLLAGVASCTRGATIDQELNPGGQREPSTPQREPNGPSSMVGTWQGYVEHLRFESGSDRVTLNIRAVTATSIEGTIRLGANPAIPLEVDAGLGSERVEGAELGLAGVKLAGRRLAFNVDLAPRYAEWCKSQQPRARAPGTDAWGCSRSVSQTGSSCTLLFDGGTSPFDCDQNVWCRQLSDHCDCKGVRCQARSRIVASVDLSFDSSRAEGSLLFNGSVRNVRLSHVSGD